MREVDAGVWDEPKPFRAFERKRRRIAGVGREILEIERPERHRAVEPGAAASLVDGDVAGEIGPADRALEAGNDPLGAGTFDMRGEVDRLRAEQPRLDHRRSEEPRVGKECVRTFRSRWAQ